VYFVDKLKVLHDQAIWEIRSAQFCVSLKRKTYLGNKEHSLTVYLSANQEALIRKRH